MSHEVPGPKMLTTKSGGISSPDGIVATAAPDRRVPRTDARNIGDDDGKSKRLTVQPPRCATARATDGTANPWEVGHYTDFTLKSGGHALAAKSHPVRVPVVQLGGQAREARPRPNS
jgi:hypothetical protein